MSQREFGGKVRYQLPVRHSSGIKLAKQSTWEEYNGMVWCPQVQSGAWVVRCNGAVMITGNSGGSSERLVTFSDAPPSWTRYGTLLIGDVTSRIESYVSSTTFTLDPNLNPGQDVASTSFTLFQTVYDMPGDFRGAWEPTNEDNRSLGYVTPTQWQQLERVWPSHSGNFAWTIMPSPDSYASWTMRVHGYPSALETLDFVYQGRPRPLRFTGYETNSRAGTIAASSGGVTVTGTSTAFSSAMIGSLLRVSSTTDQPTGLAGLNPWTEQKVVTAVASATSLTVDSAFGANYSGVAYHIADPIDVDEDLYELMIAETEYWLAKVRRSENVGTYKRLLQDATTLALENNSKLRETQRLTANVFEPFMGYPSDWRTTHADD